MYDQKVSQRTKLIKSSWAISCVRWYKLSDVSGTNSVPIIRCHDDGDKDGPWNTGEFTSFNMATAQENFIHINSVYTMWFRNVCPWSWTEIATYYSPFQHWVHCSYPLSFHTSYCLHNISFYRNFKHISGKLHS